MRRSKTYPLIVIAIGVQTDNLTNLCKDQCSQTEFVLMAEHELAYLLRNDAKSDNECDDVGCDEQSDVNKSVLLQTDESHRYVKFTIKSCDFRFRL